MFNTDSRAGNTCTESQKLVRTTCCHFSFESALRSAGTTLPLGHVLRRVCQINGVWSWGKTFAKPIWSWGKSTRMCALLRSWFVHVSKPNFSGLLATPMRD